MWTKKFWRDAAERALKGGAAAVLLAIGATEGLDLFALDPVKALGAFGGGVLISVLMSIGSAPFGESGTPSLTK